MGLGFAQRRGPASLRGGSQMIFEQQDAKRRLCRLEFDFVSHCRMLPFAADNAHLSALKLKFWQFLD
jgi:hypothetical protein